MKQYDAPEIALVHVVQETAVAITHGDYNTPLSLLIPKA